MQKALKQRRCHCLIWNYLNDNAMNDHYFNLKIDYESLLEGLNSLKESCSNYDKTSKISYKQIMSHFPLKIRNAMDHIEIMESCARTKKLWNTAELSKHLGVSRQTVYNWNKYGYLIYGASNLIDVKETVDFWKSLLSNY